MAELTYAWIGLDDTDDGDGGCTTSTMDQLLTQLELASVAGAPWEIPADSRLVRLWPRAPSRTRGNAATAACIATTNIEELEDCIKLHCRPLLSSARDRLGGASTIPMSDRIRDIHPADPGLILAKGGLPESLYWRSVRHLVDLDEVLHIFSQNDVRIIVGNMARGLIGAAAAIAWSGLHDHTFEVISYRSSKKCGSLRIVDKEIVKMNHRGTISSWDHGRNRSLISPKGPDPVLWGLRSRKQYGAQNLHEKLLASQSTESPERVRCWRTNQHTDDHISYVGEGVVVRPPLQAAGHVSIEVEDGYGEIVRLVAFGPSGRVRKEVSKLRESDALRWTGLEITGEGIHLEGIEVLSRVTGAPVRPLCTCGRRMKSSGINQGLRCRNCGRRDFDRWVDPSVKAFEIGEGWIRPPTQHRRHLSRAGHPPAAGLSADVD